MFVGPSQPGSARDRMFNDYSQQLKDTIQRVITKRRNGEEKESVNVHWSIKCIFVQLLQ